MKDTIVQEVREARAAVAADFDCDLGNFFAWAKAHTAAERKAQHPLPTQPATPAKPTRRKTAKAPVK
ncbi:MAG: hypothetical protein ABI600_17100 [Luteolibacter sp.]